MEELPDEFDTHMCLQCRSTIVGLEEYVKHKKQECPALKAVEENGGRRGASINSVVNNSGQMHVTSREPVSDPKPMTDKSENLKQDAFFSFLELQCKPNNSNNNDKQQRSRVSDKNQQLSESDIQKTTITSESVDDEENCYEYSSTLYLDLSGNEESEIDDSHPPNSHTGGKWKPGSCPTQGILSRDQRETSSPTKWKNSVNQRPHSPPPPSHTKGKWLPGKRKIDDNEDSVDEVTNEMTGDTEDNTQVDDLFNCKLCDRKLHSRLGYIRHINSPYHVKRVRLESKRDSSTLSLHDVNAKTTVDNNVSVESYECAFCDRALSSKSAYFRHVTSSLHLKRARAGCNNKENSTNVIMSTVHKKNVTSVENDPSVVRKSSREPRPNHNKFPGSDYVLTLMDNPREQQSSTDKLECIPCDRKFNNKRTLGHHLVSSLHGKRSQSQPEERQRMLFEYHDIIIKFSPFQCGICSFYFNQLNDFVSHLKSSHHLDALSEVVGLLQCVGCDFTCDTNDTMLDHVTQDKDHCDLIELMKGREPVVIKEKRVDVKCKTCQIVFSSAAAFKRHQRSSGHESSISSVDTSTERRCKFCEFVGYTQASMEVHLRRTHGNEKLFVCKPCNKPFSDLVSLNIHKLSAKHRRQVSNERLFTIDNKCQSCGAHFGSFAELKNHVKIEHPDKTVVCELCKGEFVLDSELKLHFCPQETSNASLSDTSIEEFICNRCDFVGSSSSDLIFHKVLHQFPEEVAVKTPTKQNDNESKRTPNETVTRRNTNVKIRTVKLYKCPYCHKSFPKNHMKVHLNVHTGNKPYKCDQCPKSFAQAGSRHVHMRRHLGYKKYKCDQCDFAGDKPSRLKRHKLTHELHRPRSFLCDVCGTGYHDRWTLKHHMKIHFEKEFKCSEEGCRNSFRSRSELEAHLRVHRDERPYLCDTCGYRGRSQHQLNKHRRSHTGERPFNCQHCPYSAHLSSHLIRHMRIHTGSKPYKCPYCDYACNTQENIRKHILKTKKHEGKQVYPCKFCEYGCNTAAEYKDHILGNHKDKVENKDIDVISLIAGIYKRDDVKEPEILIPYVPRFERRKTAAAAKSTNVPKKKRCKKSNKSTEKQKIADPEECEIDSATEQIVYTIEVPATDEIFENRTAEENMFLHLDTVDTVVDTEGQTYQREQVFVPNPPRNENIITENLVQTEFVEGIDGGSTILIYMPAS